MKLLLALLLVGLTSCASLGAPDRLTVTGGRGSGDMDGTKCRDFDTDESWIAVGVEFPLIWQSRTRVCPPPEAPPWTPPAPPDPTPPDDPPPAPPVVKDPPWWEDYSLVYGLVMLVAGGAIAKGAGPGLRKARALVKRQG